MKYTSFKRLTIEDADSLHQLLANSNELYIQYFSPFNFDIDTIRRVILNSCKDQIFGIFIHSNSVCTSSIVGFYMLRGLDEGYIDPMYGIFISEEFSSKSLAKLSLFHAENFCKMNNFKKLLLKVNIENKKAKELYIYFGFKVTKQLSKSIILMEKQM